LADEKFWFNTIIIVIQIIKIKTERIQRQGKMKLLIEHPVAIDPITIGLKPEIFKENIFQFNNKNSTFKSTPKSIKT